MLWYHGYSVSFYKRLNGVPCPRVKAAQCELVIHLYLLNPWCTVLLEKLTGLQLVKKFPAFHGTRRLITALTSVRQLSLSWASPIQSIYPHPTSWRSILILSTHLRLCLPSGLFPSGFYNFQSLFCVEPYLQSPNPFQVNLLNLGQGRLVQMIKCSQDML